MTQMQDESVDRFVIRLQKQSKRCNFGYQETENVKDQVIAGCRSNVLRRELLKKGQANLNEILNIANIFESVTEQEKLFVSNQRTSITSEGVHKIDIQNIAQDNRQSFGLQYGVECNRCGYRGHKANDEKCPAIGKHCNKCGGRNHFYQRCRSSYKRKFQITSNDFKNKRNDGHFIPTKRAKSESVKLISTESGEYVFCVDGDDGSNEVECKVGGIKIKMIIDSGSKYNLINEKSWNELKDAKIIVKNQQRGSEKSFKAYGGHSLNIMGVFDAEIEFRKEKLLAHFYVVKGDGKILLGRETAMMLGVLRIDTNINTIENNCEIGKIKDIVIEIPINKNVKPVMQPYRRVPVALENAVDAKINELLEQGIIEPVNGPSKWVSPAVVIPKGNDVRICVDMRRANECVEKENHPLPTMDDLLPHIGKGKWFTKLDIKNAFHQVV